METVIQKVRDALRANPKRWLLTGAAGFIGSNILETLLSLGQTVRAVDNFSTGKQQNLRDVRNTAGESAWRLCEFIEGDIVDERFCETICTDIEIVCHQAAIGSVPRSIQNAPKSHASNSTGFLHLIDAAAKQNVKRFVFASSSSVYGDSEALPKREPVLGKPLSPYAVTKRENELYAQVYADLFDIQVIGLRYFNVFGPRQDPNGPYAAVIPKWILAFLGKGDLIINGTGETTRDFCFVQNAVQANLLAACVETPHALNTNYNIAVGTQTSLLNLINLIQSAFHAADIPCKPPPILRNPFRPGDVLHSLADITLAQQNLGYQPSHSLQQGLQETVAWFAKAFSEVQASS